MRDLGILVDIAAIVAVTILALTHELPSAVTAVLVGMIVAARFKSPDERASASGIVASRLTKSIRPGKPPSIPPGASGVITLLAGLASVAHYIRR